jgi:iron transport multicopper oxidase
MIHKYLMYTLLNNYDSTCLNDKTYVSQKVPTLYSAATMGDANSNGDLYGAVQAFVVNYGEVVEIVINNLDEAIHPFHLHGHQFQIVEHPASGAGKWSGSTSAAKAIPPTRDVLTVHGNSYVVLRIVADNPGVFLIHCHIEWHVEMGSSATLIEAPEKLHGYPIPQDHIDACNQAGIPVAGNAAGNTVNVQDTSGFNTVPPMQYYGATWPVPGSSKKTREVRRSIRGRAWKP